MSPFDVKHLLDTNRESTFASTSEEVEFLREQVEFLREQIDSSQQLVKYLDSKLLDKQQQIQVLERELAQTNKELCDVLTRQQQEIGKMKRVV